MGAANGQVRGRLYVHTFTKRLYRKGTRTTSKMKQQRTKNAHEKKSRHFLGGIQVVRGTFSAVSSIGGTFWAVSSVGGTFWAVSSDGGTFWAVSRVAGTLLAVFRVGSTFYTVSRVADTFWRYAELAVLLAVSRVGGNVLAVGCFPFFGGNTMAAGGITKIWW